MNHAEQLEEARRVIAAWRERPPEVADHVVDQTEAATRDARRGVEAMVPALATLSPEQVWTTARTQASLDDEIAARLLVLVATLRVCPHLAAGPRPGFAMLGASVVACRPCLLATPPPPSADAGRCDWCWATDVEHFWPMVVQGGAIIYMGDGCRDCFAAFGGAPG